ncbi:MAG TPA: O-antigen ligase family protein [Puia sp.]|nr:O-antigen ligase family protein [Puia sp.]
MRTAAPLRKEQKILASVLLAIALMAVTAGISILLAKTSYIIGLLILGGAAAIVISIFCVAYPVFGFYSTLFVSVFFSDLARFFDTSLPLGTAIDVMVLLTFLGLLLKKLTKREAFWKHCNSPIVYAFGVYILYTALQIFNPDAASRDTSLLIIRRFFVFQIFFYCSIQIFSEPAQIFRFLKVWLVLGLIVALYGCYQEWIGYPAYELDYIYSDQHLVGLYALLNGNFRKFSFVSDPAAFGILMAAIALICMVFLLNSKFNAKRSIPLAACAMICLFAMSYSGTRTAYFAFVIGVMLYILMTMNNFKTLLFACFAIATFVALIFGPFYSNLTLNRIRSTFKFSKEASLQVRDDNRKRIQPYLRAHPFGGGLGSTASATSSGRSNQEQVARPSNHPLANFPSDSGFLRSGLETGWIGLILQCILLFIVLQQGIRAYYQSTQRKFKIVVLATVIGLFCYIVANYSQVAIGALPGAFLFYPLIAIIISIRQISVNSFLSSQIHQP